MSEYKLKNLNRHRGIMGWEGLIINMILVKLYQLDHHVQSNLKVLTKLNLGVNIL